MFKKILPNEIRRYLAKWLLILASIQIVAQTIYLYISSFQDLSVEILKTFNSAIGALTNLFFLFVPFFIVKKSLALDNKSGKFYGWKIGFITSSITMALLLMFDLLGFGIQISAHRIKLSFFPTLILLWLIASIIFIAIGTVSGGIAQAIFKRK